MSETPLEPTPAEPQPEEAEPVAPDPGEADEAGEAEEADEPGHESGPAADDLPAPSQEGEAPQANRAGQAEYDEWRKKSDRSFNTYKKVVLGNYPGPEGEVLEIAIGPGAPQGFINLQDAGRVPEEFMAPVKAFFGLARPITYKNDPNTNTCPACDGEGLTATGSHVPGNESHKCPECRGFGYVPPPVTASNGEVPAADFHAPAGEQVGPLSSEDRDNWGEAKHLPDGRENPNYGKQPQFKVPVPPWGITANLTAQDAVAS